MVSRLIAAAMASAATTDTTAAIHRERTEISPRATGLSVRPAATSRAASQASLDQPTESCPASMAGATRTGPSPAWRRFRRQRRRRDGDGEAGTWVTGDKQCAHADHGPPVDVDQLLFMGDPLSLKGANPAEWLALRTRLVPTAAAEAWGGMAHLGRAGRGCSHWDHCPAGKRSCDRTIR